MKYCILLAIVFIVSSCTKEPEKVELSGNYLIEESMSIGRGEILTFAPGSTIRFAKDATITSYSDIIIEGTEAEPITLISEDATNDHWILETQETAKRFELTHVNIVNGLLTSRGSNCHFKNVNFFNDKNLEWNSAATRFWSGEILLEDCTLDWNRKGEGFLVHSVNQPIVRNCTFKKVNDAVEYLDCSDGVIENCTFLSNSDDAIDLNNCDNILMTNNEFYGTQDRAMEIGSEGFGNSTNIRVINNLFVDCKIAVNVKENSDAIIENATIVRGKTGFEIINEEDNGLSSNALATKSVIVETKWPTYTNNSTLDLEDCMSSEELKNAINTIQTNIFFADSTQNDYRIVSSDFPTGYDATTIGYQK